MKPILAAAAVLASLAAAAAPPPTDEKLLAQLDREYQLAVKLNDARAIELIQAEDMVLVTGSGKVIPGAEIVANARKGSVRYEIQDEERDTQKVRVWGDTAVVTALLRVKGREGDRAFDYRLWFSDTYVRRGGRWRYVFGQASLPLPRE